MAHYFLFLLCSVVHNSEIFLLEHNFYAYQLAIHLTITIFFLHKKQSSELILHKSFIFKRRKCFFFFFLISDIIFVLQHKMISSADILQLKKETAGENYTWKLHCTRFGPASLHILPSEVSKTRYSPVPLRVPIFDRILKVFLIQCNDTTQLEYSSQMHFTKAVYALHVLEQSKAQPVRRETHEHG